MPVQATSVVTRRRVRYVSAAVPDIKHTIDECSDPRNPNCACPGCLAALAWFEETEFFVSGRGAHLVAVA